VRCLLQSHLRVDCRELARRTRRLATCVAALLALPALASGDPVRDAADAVVAAHRAGQDLASLATADAPGPWLVADELCARDMIDVAEAFAKAAPRVDVARLPALVATRRVKPPDQAARGALASAEEALRAKAFARALEVSRAAGPRDDPVASIRLQCVRAAALRALGQLGESAEAWRAAAAEARALGRLRKSAEALHGAGEAAFDGGDLRGGLKDWSGSLELHELRGDRRGKAAQLGNIGNIHNALGAYAEALEYQQRALNAT